MGKSLLLVERYNQIFLDFMIFVLNTRTMATRAKSQLANLMAYRYYVKHKKGYKYINNTYQICYMTFSKPLFVYIHVHAHNSVYTD